MNWISQAWVREFLKEEIVDFNSCQVVWRPTFLGPPSAGERPRARVVSLCVGDAFVWIGGGAGRALGRSSGSVIKVKTTLRQKKRSVKWRRPRGLLFSAYGIHVSDKSARLGLSTF